MSIRSPDQAGEVNHKPELCLLRLKGDRVSGFDAGEAALRADAEAIEIDEAAGVGHAAAQLRRFVKSRAYVPLHELRRRFDLRGDEDEVSPMQVHGEHLFVGLPPREATLLAELLGAGDIGFELLLDPASPLVIGVYPMRPVPRP